MEDFINNIKTGNCVDLMKELPDDIIDLTLTSPPYDNLRTYKGYVFPFGAIVSQLYRITKKGGLMVLFLRKKINGSLCLYFPTWACQLSLAQYYNTALLHHHASPSAM